MKVRALTSFGGSRYGHVPEGHVFDLPAGVDWLQAGLVEPVGETLETASLEAPEKAVKPRARRKTAKKKGS